MKRIWIWALAALSALPTVAVTSDLAAAADAAAAHRARFGQLAKLAGSCWSGEFDNGARNVHCWEWAIDEKFLRDRHTVTGADGGVYSGETLYGWDAADETLRFWYFNSLGVVSEGTATPEGERMSFVQSYSDASRELSIRSFMEMPGDDLYRVTTERREGDSWEWMMSIEYRRLDAPPSVEGER